MNKEPIIQSIVDVDCYKHSMGQLSLFGKTAGLAYESLDVEYEFINRGKTPFPAGFDYALRREVDALASLRLAREEKSFLRDYCPYLSRSYLDFLDGYKFDPKEVTIHQSGGDLRVVVAGPWYRTIYWETLLLAIISELYHRMAGSPEVDLAKLFERTQEKYDLLADENCVFAEFGTRRRFSRQVQETVIDALFKSDMGAGNFVGTSNVHLSRIYELRPKGTMAHEIFMLHAALFGYRWSTQYTLEAWVDQFQGDLGTALTDTLTTDVFLRHFGMKYAKLFDSARHDSGDPFKFGNKFIQHYQKLGIDPMSKSAHFTNRVNAELAIKIQQAFTGKIKVAFGMGEFWTGDLPGVTPLNIVIKMTKCNGIPTIKLSDDVGKHSGPTSEIMKAKEELGIAS